MARILSVSRNIHLLHKRNHALAMAGYSVRSPKTPADAASLLTESDFQAVIIGHSVAPEQRKQTIPALRNVNPNIPIIFVYATPELGVEPLADICVDVSHDPDKLVKVLDDIGLRGR
jgi:DNA-binding NtrC family response regulator